MKIEINIKYEAMCLQRIIINFLMLFIIEDRLEMSNMSRYYCFKRLDMWDDITKLILESFYICKPFTSLQVLRSWQFSSNGLMLKCVREREKEKDRK